VRLAERLICPSHIKSAKAASPPLRKVLAELGLPPNQVGHGGRTGCSPTCWRATVSACSPCWLKPVDPRANLPARHPANGRSCAWPAGFSPPAWDRWHCGALSRWERACCRGSRHAAPECREFAALASSLASKQRQVYAITLVTSGASGWAARPGAGQRPARWWLYRPEPPAIGQGRADWGSTEAAFRTPRGLWWPGCC